MATQPRRATSAVAVLAVAGLLFAVSGSAATGQTPSPTTRSRSTHAVDAKVVGTVVSAGQAPLANVAVEVRATRTGFGPEVTFIPLVVFTGGLALLPCITGACFDRSRNSIVASTATAADGTYSGVLPDSYVAGTETDTDWVVSAALPAGEGQRLGPSSDFEFEVNIATQDAPPLPLWDAVPKVTVNGWAVGVDAGHGAPSVDDLKVRLVSEKGALESSGKSHVFDARLLEPPAGASPELSVMAQGKRDVRVNHANGRTIYHQRVRSALVAVDLTPVPPSRGAPCNGLRRDGQPAVISGPAGCSATDGDLATAISPLPAGPEPDPFATTTTAPPDPAAVTEVTTQLVDPIDLGLVVLHGASLGMRVEASADGSTWTRCTTVAAPDVTDGRMVLATPTSPVTARYVRVSDPERVVMTEMSAWKMVPGSFPGAPGPSVLPADPAAREHLGGNGGDHTAAGFVAGLLIAGVAVFLVRRRQGSLP